MTPKQAEQFNNMRDTLKRIAKGYQTPDQLARSSACSFSYTEMLIMAYENIQQEAKNASKGVRAV